MNRSLAKSTSVKSGSPPAEHGVSSPELGTPMNSEHHKIKSPPNRIHTTLYGEFSSSKVGNSRYHCTIRDGEGAVAFFRMDTGARRLLFFSLRASFSSHLPQLLVTYLSRQRLPSPPFPLSHVTPAPVDRTKTVGRQGRTTRRGQLPPPPTFLPCAGATATSGNRRRRPRGEREGQ